MMFDILILKRYPWFVKLIILITIIMVVNAQKFFLYIISLINCRYEVDMIKSNGFMIGIIIL
jgi:hypothetical protein